MFSVFLGCTVRFNVFKLDQGDSSQTWLKQCLNNVAEECVPGSLVFQKYNCLNLV